MSTFFNILVYGLLAGLATVAGLYLVLYKESWVRKNSVYLISFSAGVLLAVAFSHILPEALELNSNALVWVLASFVGFYILEHVLVMHSCHEDDHCEVHPIDKIAILGMTFHSLLDGVIIGVGFEISFTLGLAAALSVILHKIPDGISMTSILLHSEYSKKQAKKYSYLVALATPVGAWGSLLILKDIQAYVLGILLAIAAGSFLYLAAADLVPEIHKKSKALNIVLLLLGVLFTYLIKQFF